MFNVLKSFFLPFEREGSFDITLIPAYAHLYAFRCGVVSALLFGFSGLSQQAEFPTLSAFLFSASCLFAVLTGIFFAAVLDFRR